MLKNVSEKEIVVRETAGIPRCGEFVRVGVPFARGELTDAAHLFLLSPEGDEVPVQATPLNRWGDGSCKWVLVDFAASVASLGEVLFRLGTRPGSAPAAPPGVRIIRGEQHWRVETGAAVFTLDLTEFRPFLEVRGAAGETVASSASCTLVGADASRTCATVESVVLESEGPLRSVVALTGRIGSEARLVGRLHFFAGKSLVIMELALHNPRPARHPGGLWDLGDAASLHFKEFALELGVPKETEVELSPTEGDATVRCAEGEAVLSLYQESSGGENWHSPVHRCADGSMPLTMRGYRVRHGDRDLSSGMRGTPIIWCGRGATGVAAFIPRFWQEFPKALAAGEGKLKISLFPGSFPVLHELQGGERKTHTVYLDFAAAPEGLAWARAPLTAAPSPGSVRRAEVLPELPTAGEGELVERFIGGPAEFLQKREVVDEYGWRNFGDLYADHEGVYHEGGEPFVSHYNNQYDPLAGMYRMFLSGGAPLWGELAGDLARHLLDVDLYHTDGDREEYNHGLFWHTDHYLPAGLATHRSFSREQVGERDPRFCGGGPGAEHCYTTGLMLHHLLTGAPEARSAVLQLARWCHLSLTGSPTLLAAVKKAGSHLSQLRACAGAAPPVFPRYPLTRGTGNAINACLDAFELSGEREYLHWAEEMIRGALHPEDRIEDRSLLDAEAAWSYTVLLVAVAKYLETQERLEERGAGYGYAARALLAYARWMCKNEYPYLEKPEILEYPNETWPAQDLRKSVILYRAARYAPADERPLFLERARFFYHSAAAELSRHKTSSFTRPAALMLQNGWVGGRLAAEAAWPPVEPLPEGEGWAPTPYLGGRAVAARTVGNLVRALRGVSLKRELAWLKARL